MKRVDEAIREETKDLWEVVEDMRAVEESASETRMWTIDRLPSQSFAADHEAIRKYD